jgi:hypothetical protein
MKRGFIIACFWPKCAVTCLLSSVQLACCWQEYGKRIPGQLHHCKLKSHSTWGFCAPGSEVLRERGCKLTSSLPLNNPSAGEHHGGKQTGQDSSARGAVTQRNRREGFLGTPIPPPTPPLLWVQSAGSFKEHIPPLSPHTPLLLAPPTVCAVRGFKCDQRYTVFLSKRLFYFFHIWVFLKATDIIGRTRLWRSWDSLFPPFYIKKSFRLFHIILWG